MSVHEKCFKVLQKTVLCDVFFCQLVSIVLPRRQHVSCTLMEYRNYYTLQNKIRYVNKKVHCRNGNMLHKILFLKSHAPVNFHNATIFRRWIHTGRPNKNVLIMLKLENSCLESRLLLVINWPSSHWCWLFPTYTIPSIGIILTNVVESN